ncbi:MAG: protein-disulfide reductase DsbD [Ignavibacteria bacterium]|jgi:thiol:disulfide interchange protein DsbD|nr:protein-disulfide reductase DsbD [Ignavibacteria bacterium]MDH7527880.1 protein-disulfide reductase DsbD [Ignavibacteria bacterium]
MKKIIYLLVSLLLTTSVYSQKILTIEVSQSHTKIKSGENLYLILKVKIDPEWHINSNKPNEDYLIPSEVSINSDEGFLISQKIFPKAKELKFDFSDVPVSVFEGEFEIPLIVRIPENLKEGNYKFEIEFSYQACNNQTCLPPDKEKVLVEIGIVSNSSEEVKNSNFNFAAFEKKVEDKKESSLFDEGNLLLSFILVFLGGLALNLTPCVYPLIPITLGYFGGQSESKTSRLFALALVYVTGMAITYSIIGVVTALSGSLFGSLLQNPIVLIGIALVLVALSLSMFGLYEFQLPASWMAKFGEARSGYFGSLFMGLTMGIVAAPCIGPFVVGLLTFVGAKGDPLFGFFIFFVLALGLGFPYIFLAVFSGKIKSLPRSGEWMISVKKIFGFVLIGMAIYFLLPLLPETFRGYILPSFMILSSVYLLVFDKIGNNIKTFSYIKSAILVVIALIGLWLLIPSEKESVEWEKVNVEQINLGNGQPVIIDFYADWCVPCKELDAMTFTDKNVIEESKRFRRYKVDLTSTGSEQTQLAMKKYSIVGVPTVILFDSNGNEVKRITSFVNAEEFLKIMKEIE